MTPRWAGAAAATALAHGVQMVYLRGSVEPVSATFFTSHLLLVAVAQLLLAAVLGARQEGRAWAGAAFLLPVTLAAAPIVHGFAGAVGVGVVVTGALVLLGWLAQRRGTAAAPLAGASLGALLGAELARFHRSAYRGLATPPEAMLGVALVAAVAAGGFWFASRPRADRSQTTSARLGLLALLVLAVSAPLTISATPWPAYLPPATVAASGGPAPTVLIVLDTLRADHLAAYGYERDTMPRLERFAREHGVRVERCVSTSSWTLPAHASLFTGLYPPRHRAHKPFTDDEHPPYAYPMRRDVPTLAGLLALRGCWTTGISANFGFTAPAFGLARGFHCYRAVRDRTLELRRRSPWHPQSDGASAWAALDALVPFSADEFFGGVHYRRAEDITDEALAFLRAAQGRSFFLFLNYMEAHNPYHPPGRYADRFEGRDPALGVGLATDRLLDPVAVAAGQVLAEHERAHLGALYDGELAYLDVELDRLLRALQRHPRFDEMLVVITSDHGEALGEHNVLGHDLELMEATTRVPLFIKPGLDAEPALSPGSVVQGPVQLVDVFPLVLRHAGVPVPAGVDGVAWGRGRLTSLSWLYSSHGPWYRGVPERFARELRSVERDGFKLLLPGVGPARLYDLRQDPGESRDLAAEQPERVAALSEQLQQLAPPDRRDTVLEGRSESEALRRSLEQLGYLR